MENKYLLLKLSDKEKVIPLTKKDLTERAEGNWHITPAKIGKIQIAILLFRGQILAVFNIGPEVVFDRYLTRTRLNLQMVDDSPIVGKRIKTQVPNPASTITKEKLYDSFLK